MLCTNLFSPNKLKYVTGRKRPAVECILCAVIGRDKKVSSLEVFRSERFVVSLNLYPFNTGHLLIFPIRHIEDVRKFTDEEVLEAHTLVRVSMDVLEKLYGPRGFNVGYNVGSVSGASIAHVHMHVVPRYERELGFADIIGGAKLIVENPTVTLKKVMRAFEKGFGKSGNKGIKIKDKKQ